MTIGALYFTVIPLYKTAALEEAIAKREAELLSAETRLVKAEKSLQEINEKLYVRVRSELFRAFVFQAGAECSGLLRKPEPLLKLGEHREKKPLLEIDVRKCLTTMLDSLKPAEKLRKDDYQLISTKVEELGQVLEQRRAVALKQIASVPEQAVKDRNSWAPKGEMGERVEALLNSLGKRPANGSQFELQSAIVRTQRAIAFSFEQQVRNEIGNLHSSVPWVPGRSDSNQK